MVNIGPGWIVILIIIFIQFKFWNLLNFEKKQIKCEIRGNYMFLTFVKLTLEINVYHVLIIHVQPLCFTRDGAHYDHQQ